MHVSLSDLLTCPRCGPAHGLILLPGEVHGRRVVAGVLGCPNCRERYAIRDGTADLRVPGEGPAEAGAGVSATDPGPAEHDPALGLAALLGLEAAAGVVALAGSAAARAAALARLVEAVEVVVLGGFGEAGPPPPGDFSRILVSTRLPFRGGALAGIALTGPATVLLEEAARSVRPAARLLLEPALPELRERAEAAGLVTVLDAQGTLVVARPP